MKNTNLQKELTQTTGSLQQQQSLNLLSALMGFCVCECVCVKGGKIDPRFHWLHYAVCALLTASDWQRWCELHYTKASTDQGSETIINGGFPSNQTLYQIFSSVITLH